MAEAIIITKEEIREFWPISKNINDDRLNPSVRRAQQADLKPFLGEPFYYAFVEGMEGTPSEPYQKLFDGGSFEISGQTVYFSGVKALLAAYCYYRFLKQNPVHVTRAGNKNKNDENSSEIDRAEIAIKSNEAKSEGIRLQVEIERFLNENRSDYPLWQKGTSLEEPPQTGFSFMKVPRSVQR